MMLLPVRQAFKSNFSVLWSWSSTSWSTKLTVSCLCPEDHFYQFASFVFQNVVFTNHKFANGRTDVRRPTYLRTQTYVRTGVRTVDGRKNWSTNWQIENNGSFHFLDQSFAETRLRPYDSTLVWVRNREFEINQSPQRIIANVIGDSSLTSPYFFILELAKKWSDFRSSKLNR